MPALSRRLNQLARRALSDPRLRDGVDRLLAPLAARIPALRRYRVWLIFQYAIQGEHAGAMRRARQMAALPDLDPTTLHHLGSVYRLHNHAEEGHRLIVQAAQMRDQAAAERDLDKTGWRLFPARLFHNIGHTGVLDLYLKGEMLGILEPRHRIILGGIDQFDNPTMAAYWQRHCAVITDPQTLRRLAPISDLIEERLSTVRTTKDEYLFWPQLAHAVIPAWSRSGRPPLLSLESEHRRRGYEWLHRKGMPEGAWFCALHVRANRSHTTTARNADIATYAEAVAEVTRRGGWVIRLGDQSMPALPPQPQVIDCAVDPEREEWMDVFAWAESRFLIATASGPSVMPLIFGRPAVLTNWGPMASLICSADDVVLPKPYWLEHEQRFATMTERLGLGFGIAEAQSALEEAGIQVRDNTPEEIRDAVVEMIERLEGSPQYSPDHLAAQERFRQTADAARICPAILARCYIDAYPQTL